MAFWHKIFKKNKKGGKKEENKEEKSVEAAESKTESKQEKIKTAGNVIRASHQTEKSSAAAAYGKYVFKVRTGVNKAQVRREVEKRYGVEAVSVNIVNLPGKTRRRGRITGWKPGFKKAIVTLKEGQKIEVQ